MGGGAPAFKANDLEDAEAASDELFAMPSIVVFKAARQPGVCSEDEEKLYEEPFTHQGRAVAAEPATQRCFVGTTFAFVCAVPG